MDLGKSINIALIKTGKKAPWLAKKIKIKYSALNRVIKTGKANAQTIDKIAFGLDMNSSDLIALGEIEYESK